MTISRRVIAIAFSAFVALPIALDAQTPARPAKNLPPADTTSRASTSTLQSWTSDRMRLAVGDIVTVLVDEQTLASAKLNDNQADKRSKDLGLDVGVPAAKGLPNTHTAASASFGNNGDSQRQGEATRSNGFQAQMSARVVAVSPNGLVQIRGTKLVNVDKNKQQIVVTGWIRPQDIAAANNTIESWRLADAEVTYVQQGGLGKPKSGLISRLFGAIWP